MRFVAISDTHGRHSALRVPDGDVLLFAGDMCERGTLREIESFADFLSSLPHKHKVVIAGNHDFPFQRTPESARAIMRSFTYLEDSGTEVEGCKIYGSPWQPEFYDWAFNLPRGKALEEIWAKIPEDTDVLITHGPPFGVLDTTHDGRRVGCEALAERRRGLNLKVHVFGHIHEGYGQQACRQCCSLNASIFDQRKKGLNAPFILDL